MTIDNGTAIVLVYALASIGLTIAFLLAAFVIEWSIGRLRERRRGQMRPPRHCRRWPRIQSDKSCTAAKTTKKDARNP